MRIKVINLVRAGGIHPPRAPGRYVLTEGSDVRRPARRAIVRHFQPAWLLICLCAAGCAGSGDDTAQIRQVLDAQTRAWSNGDIDGYMQGYWHSGELEFTTPNGTTRGWQATRDRYKAKYDTPEKMGRLEFTELSIDVTTKDAADVRGRYILRRVGGPTDTGRFELRFRRIDGAWRIVRDRTVGE